MTIIALGYGGIQLAPPRKWDVTATSIYVGDGRIEIWCDPPLTPSRRLIYAREIFPGGYDADGPFELIIDGTEERMPPPEISGPVVGYIIFGDWKRR